MKQVKGSKVLSIFTIILLCLSLVVTPLQSITYAQESGEQKEQDVTEQENDLVEDESLGEDDESDLTPDSDINNEIEEEIEPEEEVIDYSDLKVEIDEVSTTKDSITIHWSVNHDIVEEFNLSLEAQSGSYSIISVPGDTNTYTFENLNAREEYYIEIQAISEQINDSYIYYAYAFEAVIPDWSEEELVPVSLITVFNDDLMYNERIRIRGLDEFNKKYEVEEYIGYTEDLYLPLGKYEVTIYDYEDPSIVVTETFEIKAGVDYLNNPIQLKLRLKEAREAAEPFEFSVIKVTDNSFTLKWNDVSKITGFEIYADNWDDENDYYHEIESGRIENNISEFTLRNLNPNLIYSINFISNYLYDLDYRHYFNVKTNGKDADSPKVEFDNDALQEIIANDLGIYFRDVTVADMKDLTDLYIGYEEINSLEGIQYAHNLSYLYSYGNHITDITQLENLRKLYYLSLGNNNISNLSALSNLAELEYLYLYNNNISDVSALKDLINLDNLDLGSNEIESIEALANLSKLNYLSIYNNKIKDVSALKNLNQLNELQLSSNKISNTDGLANLSKLASLDLSNNKITDITALKNLKQLNELYLGSNEVSNIDALTNLSELTYLSLYDNQITDIGALETLGHLKGLSLSSNEISNIDALTGLTELQDLTLDYNNITDIPDLSGLTNLEYLTLDGNDIADISPLKELPSLHYLSFYDIEITEAHMETIQYLRNEGVDVYIDYYYDDGDWNDWEDEDEDFEEDIIIDREEVLKEFPEDQGFIVSEDGRTIELDLGKKGNEKVELTPEQTRMLIENNQTLDVQKEGVHTSIPASSFDRYDNEPVTVEINEVESDPNSLSSTYDFTIRQGTRTISQFDEGITLTFNVNADRAKNPNNLKVFYFNEETGKWENIGGTYHSNGTVTVVTAHFSKFTVFEAEPEAEDVEESEDTEESSENGTKTTNDDPKDDKKEVIENTADKEIDNVTTGAENTQGEAKLAKDDGKSNELPSTATNLYNLLALGLLLILLGATVYLFNRRRAQVK